MEWVTELEGAAMSVSISLCEGVEWVTEWVFPYRVFDRARRGCYECIHISV